MDSVEKNIEQSHEARRQIEVMSYKNTAMVAFDRKKRSHIGEITVKNKDSILY